MENNSSNILTPVVDVICDTVVLSCKGLYSMILKSMGKEPDFDFNSYFGSVNLFTKNDKLILDFVDIYTYNKSCKQFRGCDAN